MRFRRRYRPEPHRDTSRKRAAFHRKQRLEREALCRHRPGVRITLTPALSGSPKAL